jgi:hypothetical protein
VTIRFLAMVLSMLWLALPAFAAGEPPAGLVMAVAGTTTPPLPAMAEIPAGTPVQLAPGAQLTFLHYGRCKLVTVSGGTLTLSRTEFKTDGTIVGEKDGPCPRIHPVGGNQAGTVAGGMVMRGVGAVPRWPLDPEIVLAGKGSDRITTAAIYAEDSLDAPLVRLDVSGHALRFPAGSGRLAPNGRYVLRLTMDDPAKQTDITFIGTAPDGPALVVVLR